jgi:predicted negative regulator of RcsB-dependent stress response
VDNFETEEQQIDAIKKWWQENYKMVIVAAVLGIGSIVAVQTWKQQKLINTQTASTEFDRISQLVTQQSDTSITVRVESMMNDFGDSPYASLSVLLEVKQLVDSGNLHSAAEKLNWVIDHTPNASLRHIARMDLATVLSAQGKHEAALKLLEVEQDKFKPAYLELKGDIFVSMGRKNEAKTAYDEALQAYATLGSRAQLLQLKRNDLGNS